MKRKEIHENEERLSQLEELEIIKKDMAVEAKNCWWKLSTPHREINFNVDSTRVRLTEWITSEINMLKGELGLDD